MSIYKAHEMTVTEVWVHGGEAEDTVEVTVTFPPTNKFLTTQVGDWLVLDPYGDDGRSAKTNRRIFGAGKYGLAVNIKDGRMGTVNFSRDKEGYRAGTLHVELLEEVVPSEFLPHFTYEWWRNRKRPYHIEVDGDYALMALNREIALHELRDHITVVLRGLVPNPVKGGPESFDLHVSGGSHRLASPWDVV